MEEKQVDELQVAKEKILAERQDRMNKFGQALQNVCKEFKCDLGTQIEVTQEGKLAAKIVVVPVE